MPSGSLKKKTPDAAGERHRTSKWNLACHLVELAYDRPVPVERALRRDASRNREAVIGAAIELYAERPDVSVEEIADASGVARTTVYRHFPTRDDLFRAMYQRALEYSRVRTSRALTATDTAEANLRRLAGVMIDFGLEFRFLLSNRSAGQPVLREGREEPDTPVRRYMEGARDRGQLRADFPVHWMMSLAQALMLVAIEDLVAGHMQPEAAKHLLGETLVAALVA